MDNWYVYLLECESGSLYAGVTTDPARRFEEHRSGIGAKYTRMNKVERIVYLEKCESKRAAFKKEAQIKRMCRKEKLELIAGGGIVDNIYNKCDNLIS